MKHLILFFCIALLLPTFVLGEVLIEKKVSTERISEGGEVTITLHVSNKGSTAVEGVLLDIPPLSGSVIETMSDPNIPYMDSRRMQGYEETFVSLAPGETKMYRYLVAFENVHESALNTPLHLGKARFSDQESQHFFSNEVSLVIESDEERVCNYNFICEPGEHHANCFQDCLSGLPDGFCDALLDKRCDPDCESGEDPDCELLETAEEAKDLAIQTYTLAWVVVAIILLLVVGVVLFELNRGRHIRHLEDQISMEQKLQLQNYLRTYLSKGYALKSVKSVLVKNGWDPLLIDEMAKEVMSIKKK